jgi:hypothetical protein
VSVESISRTLLNKVTCPEGGEDSMSSRVRPDSARTEAIVDAAGDETRAGLRWAGEISIVAILSVAISAPLFSNSWTKSRVLHDLQKILPETSYMA